MGYMRRNYRAGRNADEAMDWEPEKEEWDSGSPDDFTEPAEDEYAYREDAYDEDVYDEDTYDEGAYREAVYREGAYHEDAYDGVRYPDETYGTYEDDSYDAYAGDAYEEDRYAEDSYAGRKNKSRRGIGFGWIIPAVLALVCAFSCYKFLHQLWVYEQAKSEYSGLDSLMSLWETAEAKTSDADTEETIDAPYPLLNIDYDALKEINSEFVGVIYLPVLDVKYPVAQASDNTKYLHTTFEGTSNASGCIFLDAAASPDFGDINTFIFGHNMKNETMFGSLKEFIQDEALCDEDPYIYIYQESQVLIYRIFAYYTISVEDDVYNDFSGEEAYDAYVADAVSHSFYKLSDEAREEIAFENRPRLLTLSTCYATGHVYNFVVQGALIDVEEPIVPETTG